MQQGGTFWVGVQLLEGGGDGIGDTAPQFFDGGNGFAGGGGFAEAAGGELHVTAEADVVGGLEHRFEEGLSFVHVGVGECGEHGQVGDDVAVDVDETVAAGLVLTEDGDFENFDLLAFGGGGFDAAAGFPGFPFGEEFPEPFLFGVVGEEVRVDGGSLLGLVGGGFVAAFHGGERYRIWAATDRAMAVNRPSLRIVGPSTIQRGQERL